MKEIHAYQNADGTYRVEIVEISKITRTVGRKIYESTDEKKTEIPSAGVQITVYKSIDEYKDFLTIIEKD